VHAHFANVGYLYRSLKSNNVQYAVSFYGYDYESLPYENAKWKKAYSILFKKADRIFCEGSHGVNVLMQQGCLEAKLRIQKLGVHRDNMRFIKKKKLPNSLKLVQVASFTEKKGQLDAVAAVHKLASEYPNLSLALYGNVRNKEYHQSVKDFIGKHSLEKIVSIHPYLDYAELHEELSKYDVFIHPSRYAENRDCEGGAPTILFEAQGIGMPVVSTRHCDIPNSVVEGKTALLSEEKNHKQLSTHILRFYKMDQTEYDLFSKSSFEFIRDNFDIKENLSKLRYD